MKKKICLILIIFGFLLLQVHTEKDLTNSKYQIVDVTYEIDGITKKSALSIKIPIDKEKIFNSEEEFKTYIENLNTDFENLRTIEKHTISLEYLDVKDGIIPVKLAIYIKDSFNIIAFPYPKFDSNSGLKLKLKLKDFNFAGFLTTLNTDFIYKKNQENKSSGSLGFDFEIPFEKNAVTYSVEVESSLGFEQGAYPSFNFGTGFNVSYTYKIAHFNTGVTQEIDVYEEDEKPYYYFTNKLYSSVSLDLYETEKHGTLTWTPYFSIKKRWNFKKDDKNFLKGVDLDWSHSLGMSRVNWVNNFRQGFSFSVGNSYSYNTHRKGPVDISFNTGATGFYSFFDRIGIYSRFDYYYNLHDSKSNRAGEHLRGILNRRISSDTAFSLNIDLPIKVGVVEFDKISGIKWSKYLSFELHIVPFLDMALTHDPKTNSYYKAKDGWYAGGYEIIVYPLKLRSVYGRISVGYDLSELKNVKGLRKSKGKAVRDGESIAEIFIGLGFHY